jgi:uncharacterized protein YfkK (UPF0435 family)
VDTIDIKLSVVWIYCNKNIINYNVFKSKIKQAKMDKLTDFYDLPKIKSNNWDKWTETLTRSQKKLIHKLESLIKTYINQLVLSL